MQLQDSVKLVIWDLDDTFWRGTLSEGSVERIENNILIVKTLADRGIMCSVVSKNDSDKASQVLKDWGIYDMFIFPRISWSPKGEQIKHLLDLCSLRPQNVLFIDDNVSNLREAEYYNEGIMTALPAILDDGFLDIPQLKGKDDKAHSRLKQYKLLEARRKSEEKFSSNEDFLRSSHIIISVNKDCTNHLARISELVQRTNQLNFTKIRSTTEELAELLSDSSCECAYITVRDDFGEYGIVGFYALKEGRLLHFVFSCRILGFGIENYLYKKLSYPEISVSGEVTGQLDRSYAERIDWINEGTFKSSVNDSANKGRILMISGCDLEQACAYLESDYIIDKEFTTVVNGQTVETSDTPQLLNSIELSENEKQELCREIPFFDESVTFSTKMFSGRYSTIILSVVNDYVRALYLRNSTLAGWGGYYICPTYSGYFDDQEDYLSKYSREQLEYFYRNFTFVGKEPAELFRNNLKRILDKLGSSVHVILINGIDIDVSDWIGEERINRNREMNNVVDSIVSEYPNVDLLDMRKIVVSRKSLVRHDNRHFDRTTYFVMAQELSGLCSKSVNVRNFAYVETKRFVMRIISKVKRIMRKITGM